MWKVLEYLQCTKLEQREEMKKINFINLFAHEVKKKKRNNNFLRFYRVKLKNIE